MQLKRQTLLIDENGKQGQPFSFGDGHSLIDSESKMGSNYDIPRLSFMEVSPNKCYLHGVERKDEGETMEGYKQRLHGIWSSLNINQILCSSERTKRLENGLQCQCKWSQ